MSERDDCETSVTHPVDTGDGNVLEEDQVGGNLQSCVSTRLWNESSRPHLLDVPSCESNNDRSSTPGNALETGDDHTDGVVDAITTHQYGAPDELRSSTHTSAPFPAVIFNTCFCQSFSV